MQPATRLFLITPVLSEPGGPFPDQLEAVLAAGDVACVLARHRARDERTAKAVLKPLAAIAQRHGAALLVEDDPRLAAHVDADGVHVTGIGDPLDEALERMKPDRIVGCGGFASRDDAMTAGETELDYLLFGEPGPDDVAPEAAETLEWVGWWAEIFNVPCVGYAGSLAAVGPLAEAGAEFVALGEALWADSRGASVALAEALATLAAADAARAEREGAGA